MEDSKQEPQDDHVANELEPLMGVAAYDQQQVAKWLREWTPQQLLQEVHARRFDTTLNAEEIAELTSLLQDWVRRALGAVTLRDALWVDQQRGVRVYDLICRVLTIWHYPIPRTLETLTGAAAAARAGTVLLEPQRVREAQVWVRHAYMSYRAPTEIQSETDQLVRLVEHAETQGLSLACYLLPTPHYPFPATLDTLLPSPPVPYYEPGSRFEQPTGWRRTIAITLAIFGVSSLGIPLLLGHVPAQPAGLPLGLLTLALLVGIEAGWSGYLGGFFIWLVPNLPGFRHGTGFTILPTVPLLVIGTIFLACDRHVRLLWRWIRMRGRE